MANSENVCFGWAAQCLLWAIALRCAGIKVEFVWRAKMYTKAFGVFSCAKPDRAISALIAWPQNVF